MLRAYNAGHGEYMPPEDTWDLLFDPVEYEGAPATWLRTVATWQAYRRKLPIGETLVLLEQLDDDIEWSMIIVVDDDRRAEAFEDMLEQVAEVPHGDDTTYDYWPSGVRLAAQLALGFLTCDRLATAVQEVLVAKGLDELTVEELVPEC